MSDNTMHESGPVSHNDGSASTGSPADEIGTPPHAAEILGLRVPLGIGTMLWGDTPLDRRITDRILSDDLLRLIRERAHAAGVRFVDSAEGYGGGTCELRVRRAGFTSPDTLVATKFLPTLWRWSERSVVRAARTSARRRFKLQRAAAGARGGDCAPRRNRDRLKLDHVQPDCLRSRSARRSRQSPIVAVPPLSF